MTRLIIEPYVEQKQRLPKFGRQVIGQYDDDAIVVYQAYCPSIGRFAAEHGFFGGGGFTLNRMTWIKTSFLWMMYRSGWGTKDRQEVILAIWLKRNAFNSILSQAYPAQYDPSEVNSERDRHERRAALARSPVRIQWDPDRSPSGGRLTRRAIQLGLRKHVEEAYARDWIVRIEDISDFVHEQHEHVLRRGPDKSKWYRDMVTPSERVYPVEDKEVARRIGIEEFPCTEETA